MKIEVFKGCPDDPHNMDRHHLVFHPESSGEDRIRTASNELIRRYRGMFYLGRARTHDEAVLALTGNLALPQYPTVQNDSADDPKSV